MRVYTAPLLTFFALLGACDGSLSRSAAVATDASASTAALFPVEQTNPLFGDNGIFALDPAELDQDPNAVDADCETIAEQFARHRVGLIDSVDWRNLVVSAAWEAVAGPINLAHDHGCGAATWGEGEGDVDCAGLKAQIDDGFAHLLKTPEYAEVRHRPEFMQLRVDEAVISLHGCEVPAPIAPKK